MGRTGGRENRLEEVKDNHTSAAIYQMTPSPHLCPLSFSWQIHAGSAAAGHQVVYPAYPADDGRMLASVGGGSDAAARSACQSSEGEALEQT